MFTTQLERMKSEMKELEAEYDRLDAMGGRETEILLNLRRRMDLASMIRFIEEYEARKDKKSE